MHYYTNVNSQIGKNKHSRVFITIFYFYTLHIKSSAKLEIVTGIVVWKKSTYPSILNRSLKREQR